MKIVFEFLGTYVKKESEKFPENGLFQQFCALPITTQDARDLFIEIFGENVVGMYGPEN